MKRSLLRQIALVLALSLFLTACGKNTAGTNNKPDDNNGSGNGNDVVTLTVWAEESNFAMLEKMLTAFKAKYSDTKFDIKLVQQSEGDTKNALLGDIHAAADVFTFPDDQLSGMVAAGALDPVVETDTIKSENTKESVDAATIKNTLYAYPMTADNGYFMYYNKKYFTENDVKTLDGMIAVAEKAEKKITFDAGSGWYMYSWFGNTGLKVGVNSDGVTNYCDWNSKDGDIKGVDIVNAIIKAFSSPAFVAEGFIDGVKNGSVIAGVSGVWDAVEVAAAWGSDYGACKLPTYTVAGKQVQMSSFTGYKMMGVNYYSKNKEWAHKLAAWLTNEENQTTRFAERNQGPSNIKAAKSELILKDVAIQAVIAQSEFGTLQRIGGKYWNPFSSFANVVVNGNPENRDLQEVIDSLVAGITASVAN